MAGAIRHKCDLVLVGLPIRTGPFCVQNGAERFDQIEVRPLILAADIIAAPQGAPVHHRQQRLGVVFDIEPVAHIAAIAIDRQRLTRQRVQNNHRNELFREVIGAVIVGAIGQQDRQPIGLPPGAHQMIRGGLGGRIG